MVALARKFLAIIVRAILFIGLYDLALRFVHTYPVPMPPDQQNILFLLSEKLGIRDPDDLYIFGFATIDLVVTILAYRAVIRLWRHYRIGR
ncbi:hypothetical protein DWU98_19585 [Dyella monticola]|uniref:Uncharacterized protein n=1 Tax=Dyella monticola TaxID=1927958 RepID=A0A370WSH9_9GAMM|nr:hypothetical protein DWU98_19585 [Dyella monticola]